MKRFKNPLMDLYPHLYFGVKYQNFRNNTSRKLKGKFGMVDGRIFKNGNIVPVQAEFLQLVT